MLRKSTLFRLLCLTLLSVLASFGALTVTAPSAEALWCAPTFRGCEFSHVGDFGNAICCVYLCPGGIEKTGVCEQV